MRDEGQSGRGVRQRSALITGVACAAVAVSGIGGAWASETGNQTPSAAKLVTRNVHPLRTSIGSLIIFGEVVNRGTTPAADVGVGLLNDRGERLARGATLKTSVNILRPGKTAVWVAQMSDNPKRWKRMQFQVVEQIGAEAARKQDYPAFKVRGTRLAPENPGFSQKVTGTVVNTGKKAAKVGAVTVALYEGARLVYATNLGFLYPYSTTQIVAPGKSAPFKASILGYTKKPGKIVTYVRASTKGANGFYLP